MLKIFVLALAIIAFMVIWLVSCGPSRQQQDTQQPTDTKPERFYDFTNPAQKMKLPKSLKEISGLSYYRGNQLVCVNDEEGEIFFYDTLKEDITDKKDFGKAGDYEGIEVVGNEIFVLKSNGKIKVINIATDAERTIDCSNNEVIEYEGLAYAPQTNSLLLATKEHIKAKDTEKIIYAYDLTQAQFKARYVITRAMITGKNGNTDFRPSGIAVHPVSGDIYVLASQGKKLLILTSEGLKKELIELNEKLFRQPEGICFTPSGDLFVSSEGGDKKAYILRFIYN